MNYFTLAIIAFLFCITVWIFLSYRRLVKARKHYENFTHYLKKKYYDQDLEPNFYAKQELARIKKTLSDIENSFPYSLFKS